MKNVKLVSVIFSAGSAIYWMLASIIQYQGLLPIYDTPGAPEAWIVGVVGVLPVVIYGLICLRVFRWVRSKAKSEFSQMDSDKDS